MENLRSLEPQAKISHSYKKKECKLCKVDEKRGKKCKSDHFYKGKNAEWI